jgi:hypothetical protein
MPKHPGKSRVTVEQTVKERVLEVFASVDDAHKLVITGGDNRTALEGGGIRAEASMRSSEAGW